MLLTEGGDLWEVHLLVCPDALNTTNPPGRIRVLLEYMEVRKGGREHKPFGSSPKDATDIRSKLEVDTISPSRKEGVQAHVLTVMNGSQKLVAETCTSQSMSSGFSNFIDALIFNQPCCKYNPSVLYLIIVPSCQQCEKDKTSLRQSNFRMTSNVTSIVNYDVMLASIPLHINGWIRSIVCQMLALAVKACC